MASFSFNILIFVFRRCALSSAILVFAALLVPPAAAGGEEKADAVTSASIDAATGASKQLEAVKVTDAFSVAYAENDDGSLFITAKDLTDAYRRDELASNSFFKDKTMVVKGEVEKTSKPDAAKPWITLAGDGESGKKVRCSLKAGQLTDTPVEAGDIVQIRGVCSGMILSVSLGEAEILE